jgi:hypothetical protein
LKHRQRLKNYSKRNPVCTIAVNWVIKTVRRITRKRTLQQWKTKAANCKVTPQAIWPIVKSLTKGWNKLIICNNSRFPVHRSAKIFFFSAAWNIFGKLYVF